MTKKEQKTKKKFTKLIDSDLYKSIQAALKRIQSVKSKYSFKILNQEGKFKEDADESAIKAWKMINDFENFLDASNKLLFKFDEGKIPHNIALLTNIFSIKIIVETFRKYPVDKISITHPMTYDLAKQLIGIVDKLPKTLNDLTPFLNPEALRRGFNWRLLPKFLLKPNYENEKVVSYTYSNGKDELKFGTKEYLEFRQLYEDRLHSQIASYLELTYPYVNLLGSDETVSVDSNEGDQSDVVLVPIIEPQGSTASIAQKDMDGEERDTSFKMG